MSQHSIFYGEYEIEKKTGQKIFDLPQRGFEPQIFEQFEFWGRLDQYKSRLYPSCILHVTNEKKPLPSLLVY